METDEGQANRYFQAIGSALDGLNAFLRARQATPQRDDVLAGVITEYIARLENSFACWQNKLAFVDTFKISRAESGFPVFQNVLELENDNRTAAERLITIPLAKQLRADMADFILRKKEFPAALQKSMAERIYLEAAQKGELFKSYILPRTIKVGVNSQSMRPSYMVHWGVFDGSANLPMVYLATLEDSSEKIVDALVTSDGKLNPDERIPLPVEGLLNPALARQFDDFAEKNSSYSLSPSTIATNMDKDFPTLHPKQLRRSVLGPFYSVDMTENNSTVSEVLSKVRKPENAWLLTWTIQDIFSKREIPEKKGIFSTDPAREEYHIETDDLECARMGVSSYERHALVPHEAYQALYASGETKKIFDGYKVHVLSNGQVISDV
jgi:hypothetical protein